MSTSSAAQLETDPMVESFARQENAPPVSALKRQAAERLAAHRALRHRSAQTARPELFETQTPARQEQSDTRAMRIAAAVAERYAQSQSYRAFLAAEAERATVQARTAAQAARMAEASAAAQQQLLHDLEHWGAAETELSGPALLVEAPVIQTAPPPAALKVRLYEENVRRAAVSGVANAVPHELLEDDERQALDEEIAFRQAPVFEEPIEAAMPITANLIEFPRQLVAPRKARPRLAEGPLREEPGDDTGGGAQLRIFEVEADLISHRAETEPVLPEWSSIRLSACATTEPEAAPAYDVSLPVPLYPAPSGLRLMAAMVDGCLLLGTFLGFATTAAYVAGEVPTGQLAALGSVIVLAALFVLYQLLFFTLGEATPGMRYARIGLCTFGDDNPSRAAMRRRLGAVMLAVCPLGLGLLWAWLDEDGLGWHDRISRMYQRSY